MPCQALVGRPDLGGAQHPGIAQAETELRIDSGAWSARRSRRRPAPRRQAASRARARVMAASPAFRWRWRLPSVPDCRCPKPDRRHRRCRCPGWADRSASDFGSRSSSPCQRWCRTAAAAARSGWSRRPRSSCVIVVDEILIAELGRPAADRGDEADLVVDAPTVGGEARRRRRRWRSIDAAGAGQQAAVDRAVGGERRQIRRPSTSASRTATPVSVPPSVMSWPLTITSIEPGGPATS